MDILKKIFPLSFRLSDNVANFVVGILIYVVVGTIVGVVLSFVPDLLVISMLTGLTTSIVSLYCTGGIVVLILSFVKVLK